MRTGEGLHRFVDPVDKSVYLYTQFETSDAHRMYACFDQPDLKATFALHRHRARPTGRSSPTTAPSRGRAAADRQARRLAFAPTPPMSTYITALVAGPYHVVRDIYTARRHDPARRLLPRRRWPSTSTRTSIFEVTKQGFDFFHGLFDYPYPFGKYDQLFVPEFNAGAMENAGAVTFLEDYVFRSKVTDVRLRAARRDDPARDGAHVVRRPGDHALVGRPVAQRVVRHLHRRCSCQAEATRWTNAWTTFANVEKTWAYRQDQLPSTHPIAADIVDIEAVEVNFDGITYAKGASVLKQLVAYVGRDAFFAALRTLLQGHTPRATPTLPTCSASSRRPAGATCRPGREEWLRDRGRQHAAPRVRDGRRRQRSRRSRSLQEAPADYPTLRSHRSASASTTWSTASWCAPAQRRARRRRRAHRGARAGRRARGPTWCWSTTTTSTYAKIRLDAAVAGDR